MSVLDRLRAALDAPKFCPSDGQPIEVEAIERFDPKTGLPREPLYLWHCPDVRAWIEGDGGGEWSQRGVASLHVHGMGRPAWHLSQHKEPDRDAVAEVVHQLAREALAARDQYIKNGYVMNPLPRDAEVRALLGVGPRPVDLKEPNR